MPYFVGLDVSKGMTSICVIDPQGVVVREDSVETSPKGIIDFLRGQGRRYVRVGLEACAISSWLFEGLTKAGLPVIVVESRSARGMLKANRNKTDHNDARAIADLVRVGTYRKVHSKSLASQQIQTMLTARRLLSTKARDISNLIHGVLLGFGLKLEALKPRTFDERARALAANHPFCKRVLEPLLAARAALIRERKSIEDELSTLARSDPVCRRLMTAPGIGEMAALQFRSAIDEPRRFRNSRTVAAHFGLTPRVRQSGTTAIYGRITKWGDSEVRSTLVLAAWTLLRKNTRRSWLSQWTADVAARRGGGKAMVAAARRLAIVMHRMWISETDFQWERPA